MFKEIDKLTLYACVCFVFGSMSLMLNVLSAYFNLVFILLFIAGFLMLLVKKIKEYAEFKKEITMSKESISVDMTLSSDGTFELDNSNFTKKQLREFKYLKREKRTVISALVVLLILAGFFAYRIIQALIIAG